ncbi:MAG TPA: hypothetical protein VJ743_19080 [Albitalea sp.]|nr:hypothetical protein [Albitalea sp.]
MKSSSPALPHRRTWSIADLGLTDLLSVLDTARAIKRAAHSGRPMTPLRGKHIALLGDPTGSGPQSLQRAATELGARVSHLDPIAAAAGKAGPAGTAHLLGRLYDALDCSGMPMDAIERIEREAGVPVFNGLAGIEHPARAIGELLEVQEHVNPALAGLALDFAGREDTPRAQALLRLAERAGMSVQHGGAPQRPADFSIDAREPGHWHCSHAGQPIDEAASDEDHRCVLQALLLMALG